MKNAGDDGRRKERVEKEVHQIISAYLIQNLQNELDGLVTVTRVQMQGDFRMAKVYISFFPQDEKNEMPMEQVLKELKKWSGDIQAEIDHKLKMRYCPKVTFFEDESTESILKIERIISEISKNSNSAHAESGVESSVEPSESED
jgi:ribosome-binding factor A